MFSKLWSKRKRTDSGPSALPKPKEMPDRVGRFLVVNLKLDPDAVWNWKVVTLPADPPATASQIRIYSPEQALQSGITVRHFHSLDDHPELILYSGTFDKKAGAVSLTEHTPMAQAV